MIQEARQKYYFPSLEKHIKNWVQNCQMYFQIKRYKFVFLKTELLNCPEWDLRPEDVLQMDILPNLSPRGGFDNIITAIDVFSKYLFPFPTTGMTAPTVARVIMGITQIAAVLGVELKHASTKHAQTIGTLERTHATVRAHLKAATGEFRYIWQKILPLAVLNHNTTYHDRSGCEPTLVFHGRIPHNILDYKLGYKPNARHTPQPDIAEEIQRRMEILHDQTKNEYHQN